MTTRDDVDAILRGGSLPQSALPEFLHEATHHWCHGLPFFTATFAIESHAFGMIAKGLESEYALRSCIAAMARLEAITALFEPLLEGMAILNEFDAYAEPVVKSIVLERANAVFGLCGRDRWSDLNEHLLRLRLEPAWLDRRAKLLYLRPVDAEPYLQGNVACRKLMRQRRRNHPNERASVIVSLIARFVLSDWSFIDVLIDPDRDWQAVLLAAERSIAAAFTHIAERPLESIVTEKSADEDGKLSLSVFLQSVLVDISSSSRERGDLPEVVAQALETTYRQRRYLTVSETRVTLRIEGEKVQVFDPRGDLWFEAVMRFRHDELPNGEHSPEATVQVALSTHDGHLVQSVTLNGDVIASRNFTTSSTSQSVKRNPETSAHGLRVLWVKLRERFDEARSKENWANDEMSAAASAGRHAARRLYPMPPSNASEAFFEGIPSRTLRAFSVIAAGSAIGWTPSEIDDLMRHLQSYIGASANVVEEAEAANAYLRSWGFRAAIIENDQIHVSI